MIADRECWERGCACHDTWNKGVEVVEKRPWVGLTDKQMVDAIEPIYQNRAVAEMAVNVGIADFRVIEAKLKAVNGFHSTEKNNG